MLRLEEKLSFSQNPISFPPAIDYCRTFKNEEKTVTIGTAQIIGDRPYQEDYIAVSLSALAHSTELSVKKIESAHSIAYEEMQSKYGEIKKGGSTGCTATTWIDKKNQLNIITANLGDSAAYLVVVDKNDIVDKKKSFQLTKPHKPYDPAEKARIEKQGGEVIEARLSGSVAVSRAFGDIAYKGISHIPDTGHHQIKLETGQRAFVIVASDGLETLSLENIQDIVKNNSKKSPAKIANILVNSANNEAKVADNISAAVIPVTTNRVSASVFDGHNGDKVAINVGSNFYSALEKTLSSLKTKKIEGAKKTMYRRVQDFKVPNEKNTKDLEKLCRKFEPNEFYSFSLKRDYSTMEQYIEFEANLEHYMSIGTKLEELALIYDIKINLKSDGYQIYFVEIYCPDRMPYPDSFKEFITKAQEFVNSKSYLATDEKRNETEKYLAHKETLEEMIESLRQHEKTKASGEKKLGEKLGEQLEILLQEVDKNSSEDFATALKILDSYIKIFKSPTLTNIYLHQKLTKKIMQKSSQESLQESSQESLQESSQKSLQESLRWKKAAAIMAVIGGILLIAASALVATGTWGILSVPAIATGGVGVSLVLSGLGIFKTKNSKIPTPMTEKDANVYKYEDEDVDKDVDVDAWAIHRILYAKP